MFQEFNENELKEWKDLSNEERKEKMNKGRVSMTFEIDLIVKKREKIIERHEFYQFKSSTIKDDVLYGISVIDANEDEITFTFDSPYINEKDKKFKLKEGEEREIEVGHSPYNGTYIIKVSNFVYGTTYVL